MSNLKHVVFCALGLATLTWLLGCGEVAARRPDAGGGAAITSVELSPADPSVALGSTTAFTLTAHHSDGETSDVTDEATWSSSAPAVATISATGEADTLTTGSTTITGTLDGLSDDTTLTVTAAELTGLRITPDAPTIVAGQTQTLTATAIYSDGDVDVTATAVWSTSDLLVAEPSATAGQITTLRDGAVTVIATFSGETDTTGLTITQAPIGTHRSNPGTHCAALLAAGVTTDGQYWINPTGANPFEVACDMTTAGGGWTITYDVDAAYFDGVYLNNATTFGTPPLVRNQNSDLWNAEAVMTVNETLLACGQQDNASTFYWTYSGVNPHGWLAGAASGDYQNGFASATTSALPTNCMAVHKSAASYGFAVAENNSPCGSCNTIAWGMYHYPASAAQAGCNSTSSTYGDHATPWAGGRQITYPVCNRLQTSNGRFWMAVR